VHPEPSYVSGRNQRGKKTKKKASAPVIAWYPSPLRSPEKYLQRHRPAYSYLDFQNLFLLFVKFLSRLIPDDGKKLLFSFAFRSFSSLFQIHLFHHPRRKCRLKVLKELDCFLIWNFESFLGEKGVLGVLKFLLFHCSWGLATLSFLLGS